MGQLLAKPANPYVRDRVRLCDGLAPLTGCTVAAAGAGRYVFRIGDFKWTKQPDETYMMSITLDYIDLMLLTRVRMVLGDFCNFGDFLFFYAIDERTIVLVDVNENDKTLRQRLVAIDPDKNTAHAFLDRGYQLNTRGERTHFILGQCAVSEDRVITTVPDGGRLVTIVYPKNPLDLRTPVDDLTDVIDDAADRLRREANTAEYEFGISNTDAPFFLSPTKVGFFTRRHDVRAWQQWVDGEENTALIETSRVERSYIVAYDLQADDISIVRLLPDPVTNFPCNLEQQPPHESLSVSGCGNEVGLLVTDRFTVNGWHLWAARILDAVAEEQNLQTFSPPLAPLQSNKAEAAG